MLAAAVPRAPVVVAAAVTVCHVGTHQRALCCLPVVLCACAQPSGWQLAHACWVCTHGSVLVRQACGLVHTSPRTACTAWLGSSGGRQTEASPVGSCSVLLQAAAGSSQVPASLAACHCTISVQPVLRSVLQAGRNWLWDEGCVGHMTSAAVRAVHAVYVCRVAQPWTELHACISSSSS
jgi:hypothetical protein